MCLQIKLYANQTHVLECLGGQEIKVHREVWAAVCSHWPDKDLFTTGKLMSYYRTYDSKQNRKATVKSPLVAYKCRYIRKTASG